MPLGISESLIQRAYAPVDLSGFYNGIDQASKRIAAEQRAEKLAAQKDYYNSQAIINKDMGGIKSQDIPEVNGHYNKWKSLQKKLVNISFERNPEEYARLNAEANAEYGATLSTIELSKQNKKQHEAVLTHMMQNPTKYKKDAVRTFQNIMLLPTSEATRLNDRGFTNDDISDLQYTGPTVAQRQKFEDQIMGKDIYSGAKAITYSDNKNRFAGKEMEVVDPIKVKNMANTYLSTYSDGEQGKFAQSFIDKNKNNVDEVKKAWDALPETNFEGFKVFDQKTNRFIDKYPLFISPITGKQTRKLDLFASDDPAETFIGYATAKAILINPVKEGKPFTQFPGGDIEKAELLNELATNKALLLSSVTNKYANARQERGFKFRLEEYPELQKLQMIDRTMNNLNGKIGEAEITAIIANNQDADIFSKLQEIEIRDKKLLNIPVKNIQIPVLPFAPMTQNSVSNTGVPKPSGKLPKKGYTRK